MNLRHIVDLTQVEVWRGMSLLGRLYLLGAGGLALFFVIGKATDENILVVVMGVTLGAASVTPFAVMRDKLDRTLEFLLSLPVTVAELVAARFLAAAVGLLPGALATGVAYALVVPPSEFGMLTEVTPLPMAFGFWVLLTLAAWWLTAVAASELKRLIGWSVVTMLVFVGYVVPWVLGFLDRKGPRAMVRLFLEQPYAGIGIGAVAFVVTVALASVAFGIAHRGLARSMSRPDNPL